MELNGWPFLEYLVQKYVKHALQICMDRKPISTPESSRSVILSHTSSFFRIAQALLCHELPLLPGLCTSYGAWSEEQRRSTAAAVGAEQDVGEGTAGHTLRNFCNSIN